MNLQVVFSMVYGLRLSLANKIHKNVVLRNDFKQVIDAEILITKDVMKDTGLPGCPRRLISSISSFTSCSTFILLKMRNISHSDLHLYTMYIQHCCTVHFVYLWLYGNKKAYKKGNIHVIDALNIIVWNFPKRPKFNNLR